MCFWPRGGFDGGDDLPGHADLCKRMEGSKLVGPEIPKRFEQANHALLDNILMIRANQEITARFGPHKILVLVEQVFRCVGIALLCQQGDFFIGHAFKVVVHRFLLGHARLRPASLLAPAHAVKDLPLMRRKP